jgi:ribonuclease P protein component
MDFSHANWLGLVYCLEEEEKEEKHYLSKHPLFKWIFNYGGKMKKKDIIKKGEDFTRIIKKREGISNKYFILNQEPNEYPLFGITFVKNIGNAVTRNKLKRQIKSIIDNNKGIYINKNYVIIIKKAAKGEEYKILEENLIKIFNKIKEKQNG